MMLKIFIWSLGLVGTVTVGAGIFWFIFNRYAEIEARVLQSMSDYAAELYDYLDRMFLRRPLSHCYLMILIPTILFSIVGFVGGLYLGFFQAIIGAALVGAMGYKLPRSIIRGIFMRRIQKFDRQLVDALNMMSNAIKSGLSFMQVVAVIEREMPNPCSEEFGMVLKENRVGVNLTDALMNMTKRVPSDDLFMIINSVVTLSQQGGDLSEAFETIAMTIRERQRVADKIRTLAQAGITQATILSSLPLVMLGIQWFVQPKYVIIFFTTPLGLGMFVGMLLMIGTGAYIMKQILTIEI
ncbi:MAG: type II secretion system F family protein [Deltaproteobacteria bacterium]|nr:type II secretion system F family protein [Deltaproteobacteria bacterium]